MSYEALIESLDMLLPDEVAIAEIRKILTQYAVDGVFHIELEEDIYIPADVEIFMMTKALFKEYFLLEGFGDIKVMVSLGEVQGSNGIYESTYCFATLYFNAEAKMITHDFHTEWR